MPRNDRYRPSQLRKMVTPEMRAEAARRDQEQLELERQRASRLVLVPGSPPPRVFVNGRETIGSMVTCRHNEPWLRCTLCSKPRTP